MTQNLNFTSSERQHQQLVINDYIFSKTITRTNGDIYWQCVCKKTVKDKELSINCKSGCTTRNGQLLKPPTEHNHEPTSTATSLILKQELKANIKKRAREDKKTPIPTIFKEELQKITMRNPNIEQTTENAKAICSLKSYACSVYNEKNNKGELQDLTNKRPKIIDDIKLDNTKYTLTSANKPFLLFDEKYNSKRMICYASTNQLLILSHCERIHMDGTFDAAAIFYQLYIIYGWYKGIIFSFIHSVIHSILTLI